VGDKASAHLPLDAPAPGKSRIKSGQSREYGRASFHTSAGAVICC